MDEIIFGVLPEKKDVRDYKIAAAAVEESFPEEFELKTCAVKNQGSVGSCVAHALAEVVEYHNKIQNNITKKASTGFIYGNRRNSLSRTSGMYVREALSNMVNYGDTYRADFPENVEVPDAINLFEERFEQLKDSAYHQRFSSYVRLRSDSEIKHALMNYGPVVFSMNWYSDILVGLDGIIHTKQNKADIKGGHCMIIYGWDKNGWKIQNSWGTFWGLGGKAILPFNIKMTEIWAVIDNILADDTDIKKPFHTRFAQFIAKLLNWLLNLFRRK